jgi:hypothetical protein
MIGYKYRIDIQAFFKFGQSEAIPSFYIRPARNALKLVRVKFNNLIHNSMITLTQRTMHGRRVFEILRFCGSLLTEP